MESRAAPAGALSPQWVLRRADKLVPCAGPSLRAPMSLVGDPGAYKAHKALTGLAHPSSDLSSMELHPPWLILPQGLCVCHLCPLRCCSLSVCAPGSLSKVCEDWLLAMSLSPSSSDLLTYQVQLQRSPFLSRALHLHNCMPLPVGVFGPFLYSRPPLRYHLFGFSSPDGQRECNQPHFPLYSVWN